LTVAVSPITWGGDFGSWNYAPNDETQGCWDFFYDINYDGGEGKSIELEHDVASANPAFCGFWMKIGNLDLTPYGMMTFWVKGSEKVGFTSRFKIELRNKRGKRAVYTISGITEEWQSFEVPFKQTRALKDWSSMQELTIVFDDILATKKTGKIYLDQVSFRKFTPEEAATYAPAEPQSVSE